MLLRLVPEYGTNLTFSSAPNDSTLGCTKLTAFSENKLILVQMMVSVVNVVGIEENDSFRYFLLHPDYFPMLSSSRPVKLETVRVKS